MHSNIGNLFIQSDVYATMYLSRISPPNWGALTVMVLEEGLSATDAGALVKKRRKERGLTQEQLVDQTGLSSQSYLSALENGRYHIGRSDHFGAVARVLRLSDEDIKAINPSAVITAAAPTASAERHFASTTAPLDEAEARRVFYEVKEEYAPNLAVIELTVTDTGKWGFCAKALLEQNKTFIVDIDRKPQSEVHPVPDLHRIPVRGMAAAGDAFYSDDNILDFEYVANDEYRVGMLAVQIEGDSMEPTIPNGSRVYIDPHLTDPQDGKMFLVHVHDNGFVVKRAKVVGDTWLLLSDNPLYQAFTPDEATVVGQVYFVQPRGWRA